MPSTKKRLAVMLSQVNVVCHFRPISEKNLFFQLMLHYFRQPPNCRIKRCRAEIVKMTYWRISSNRHFIALDLTSPELI
jgi:hypothetical protein